MMKKIYLNVDEKDRHKLRGIPLRHFPDEMDIGPEFKVNLEEFSERLIPQSKPNGAYDFNKCFRSVENLEDALFNLLLKVEKESEKHLKAMMWFHQDYNPKHYSFTVHPSNIIHGDNGSRFEISRTLEYHPPKRNGHRRNHAPSELYKDFFDKVAQEDIEKNSPVKTPFGEEYGLMKQLGLK